MTYQDVATLKYGDIVSIGEGGGKGEIIAITKLVGDADPKTGRQEYGICIDDVVTHKVYDIWTMHKKGMRWLGMLTLVDAGVR